MNNKKKYLESLWLYFAVVLLIFLIIQKPLFLLYNWSHGGSQCSISDLLQIYRHGLRLDLATTAYLTAIPALLLTIKSFIFRFNAVKVWKIYNIVIGILLGLITIADASLYEFWDFKLDSTVFMYINDPKNAAASVSIGYIIARALIWAVLSVVYILLMNLPVRKLSRQRFSYHSKKNKVAWGAAMVLTFGLLFVFIRGIDVWPNNPGAAYYSKTLFHNHTALNPAFNVIYSCTRPQKFSNQYQTLDQKLCSQVIKEMYPTLKGQTLNVLNKQRPNVVVLVLEGMGACFVESLGGEKEVAPNISRLLGESINFKNAYCSSFRTDRGIVATLSGYPGQPNTSIMRYSNKTQNLPGLPKTLRENGYDTSVLYASDATFFNMSSYFLTSGHDRLVTQDDFTAEERSTQWGVPDHIAFDRLLDIIKEQDKDKSHPHYNTMLTISSHTPFDVPYHKLADEKRNSFAYTDSCVGDFFTKLRNTPAWDNIMVVVTADHGFNHEPTSSPKFAHVPFFIIGGAVNTPMEIDAITCQTDLPAIVLAQLGIDHSDFTFSRNTLADDYTDQWAINTFNDGFTLFDKRGATVYLNQSNEALYGPDSIRELRGKAFLQNLYQDLDRR